MADDKKPKEQQDLPEGWKWVRLGEIRVFILIAEPMELLITLIATFLKGSLFF